tara:strand:+ start:218 stop:754 length:537 start_codon:yes stop_codon:yes gene_type:complete
MLIKYLPNLMIDRKMKKYILITLLGIAICQQYNNNYTLGMSENLGLHGVLNANVYFNKNIPYYITFGSFIFPFMGGAGIGYRKDYIKTSRLSYFTSSTIAVTYLLPLMCSTDNCNDKYDMLLSASIGLNILLFETDTKIYNFQLGALTQHAFFNIAIDKSANNIPGLTPVINFKIQKK